MEDTINKINELKKQGIVLRKKILIEKIDAVSEYEGVDGLYDCIKILREVSSFKTGDCIDFDMFREEYLTSFENFKKFNNIWTDSSYDIDELIYIGFDNNLSVVNCNEMPDKLYDEIMNYEFSDDELCSFEKRMDSLWEGIEALYLQILLKIKEMETMDNLKQYEELFAQMDLFYAPIKENLMETFKRAGFGVIELNNKGDTGEYLIKQLSWDMSESEVLTVVKGIFDIFDLELCMDRYSLLIYTYCEKVSKEIYKITFSDENKEIDRWDRNMVYYNSC